MLLLEYRLLSIIIMSVGSCLATYKQCVAEHIFTPHACARGKVISRVVVVIIIVVVVVVSTKITISRDIGV